MVKSDAARADLQPVLAMCTAYRVSDIPDTVARRSPVRAARRKRSRTSWLLEACHNFASTAEPERRSVVSRIPTSWWNRKRARLAERSN